MAVDTFTDRWTSGAQVGDAAPSHQVLIRQGRFVRGYQEWTGPPVGARIYGESESKPWSATWTPRSSWQDVPNITEIDITQDYDANGLLVATITLHNVGAIQQIGPHGYPYMLLERGWLSPWRGSSAPVRGPVLPANEWTDLFDRNAQIKVWQGYGDDAREPTFTGLIDDIDMTSAPDRVTLVARDFGQAIVDQHVFGWVKSKQLPEPVVFEPKGGKDGSTGEGVGYDAKASSARDGHPARFVTDTDTNSAWIGENHTVEDATEWVEIRVPRGRYESIAIHTAYPGMEVFVGVYARSDGLGGEPCQVDDRDIGDGWVFSSELGVDEGGMVPGDNGGWPYVRRWASMTDKGHTNTLPGKFELGDDSVIRVGFRNLHRITPGVFRAGVVRLAGVKRKSQAIRLRPVGEQAEASSTHGAEYKPANVLDTDRSTRWLSADHSTAAVTEWVEIHLPKGRYDSFEIQPAYDGMEMFVGVYARKDGRDGKKCQVDDVEVDDGFIALGNGDVPGSNGGWPWIKHVASVDALDKAEKFALGHKLELGEGSVLRVGFRNLALIDAGVRRAGVVRLKALTRSGLTQAKPAPKNKVIEVDDASDIVKVALRWAGFKTWHVEETGVGMTGRISFNRADTLMDIIKKVQEATGFVFYMKEPTAEDASIGIPTFESNLSIAELPNLPVLRDDDLLTGVQTKHTDEPLATDIRVRGKVSEKYGKTLGSGTSAKRVMAHYKPPWGIRSNRLAGLIKHVVAIYPKVRHTDECMILAQLIALAEALAASAAEIEVPGTNRLSLNRQVVLIDEGTGLNTRLYTARRQSSYRATSEDGTGGSDAVWSTTIGGALIDTLNVQGVIADLRASLIAKGLDPNKIQVGDSYFAATA